MSRAVNQTWYRVALARSGGAPVLLAAQGEHLGAAIGAAERHVHGSYAIAAEVAAGNEIPLGESVGKHHVVELGAADGETSTFRWPIGVMPQLGHTAPLAGARRGYMIHADPKLLVIEAQTDREHLVDLFLGVLERLPSADNLEVRVQDHFDDAGHTDVWLTSRVNAKKIIRFLDDYDDELIHNGHVELSIYVRAHRATLRLTEHKTVVWLADKEDPARTLETDVHAWLRELSVPRIDELVTVTEVPHFHYRGAKTRDRKKLSDELYRQRLRRVDTLATPPGRDAAGRDTDG